MQSIVVEETAVQSAGSDISGLCDLGERILILVENCDDCVKELRTMVSQIAHAERCSFTLLHCCPPIYWEHGGSSVEAQRQFRQVWQAEEMDFQETQYYFDQVNEILQDRRVPVKNISTRLVLQGNLLEATVRQLQQGQHTGIILCGSHTEIVNRLRSQNVFTKFINLLKPPTVAICTFNSGNLPQLNYTIG